MILRIKGWDEHYETHNTRILEHMHWYRMTTKETPGSLRLKNHPDGAAHLGVWSALCGVAARGGRGKRGVFASSDGVPYSTETIALLCHFPPQIVQEAILRLLTPEIGWLECVDVSGKQINDLPVTAGVAPDSGAQIREIRVEKNIKPYSRPAPPDRAQLDLEPKTEEEPEPPAKPSLGELQDEWFEEELWPIYWRSGSRDRKEGKEESRKAFHRHAKSLIIKDQIVLAVKGQSAMYLERSPEHRPLLATWLNKKRYLAWMEDAAPVVSVSTPTLWSSGTIDRLAQEDPVYYLKVLENKVKQGFIPAAELERARKRLGVGGGGDARATETR